jgi:hypothetical protein
VPLLPQQSLSQLVQMRAPFDKVKQAALDAGFKVVTVDAAPQEFEVSDAVEFSFKAA